jgi:hypothetical protein
MPVAEQNGVSIFFFEQDIVQNPSSNILKFT